MTGRAKCDLLINNVCEVFNRQLLDARDSPIISCLEYVREYLMKRIVIVQKVIEKSEGPLTPAITKLFRFTKEAAANYSVEWNGAELCQVKGAWGEQCVVNLNERVCSCRKWEVSGIPCRHAVAVIYDMANNGMDVGLPEDYVHESYKLDTWKNVYSFKINPVSGKQYWEKYECPTTLIPPKQVAKPGRPQKSRRKSAGEVCLVKDGKLSRKGKTVTCVLCKGKGHNKRSCKAPTTHNAGSQSAGQTGGSKRQRTTNEAGGSQSVGKSKKSKNQLPSQTGGNEVGSSQAASQLASQH